MFEKKEVVVSAECPDCHSVYDLTSVIECDPLHFAPDLRSGLYPTEMMYKYKFTSNDIAKFIYDLARERVPNIEIQVVSFYCERKRRKETEPHHSYATLRVAFSDSSIKKNEDMGWYGKIGRQDKVYMVESLFKDIVERYRYNRKELDKLMKSYKRMEELEEGLGLTEAFINEIKLYAEPRRIVTANNKQWVFVSMAPEKIILDMMSDAMTKELIGKIKIQDVYPINKDTVEFEVWVKPHDLVMNENPHVRQILRGEEKAKNN